MFPPEIQTIFDAQTALQAGNNNDPRFDALVKALVERTGLDANTVVQKIVQLAQGNIHL